MLANGLIPTATVSSPGPDGRASARTMSERFVLGVALAVGLVSFVATEFLHYLLVPDIGRDKERLLAEALSALVVSCLAAKLAHITAKQQRLTVARMQVIAEMNHHIRNALAPISLSSDLAENQQLVQVISQGVDRIEWALREVLPREIPFGQERSSLVDSRNRKGRPAAGEQNKNAMP